MVETQIKSRGIKDENVIRAMSKIPRHIFVPSGNRAAAYSDYPLAIGEGQTISQPYIVALMTQCLNLQPSDSVLEIGTGCGYQTAILAEIAQKVYTVEIIPELFQKSRELLKKLDYENIYFSLGDGSLGWEEYAPYDKILVSAAAPDIPSVLFQQLKEGGRFVVPVGSKYAQDLKLVFKKNGNMKVESICGCIFVPLVGKSGWR